MPFSAVLQANPELKSLYEIYQLPQPRGGVQDYFNGVMAILSEYFSVGYSAIVLYDPKKDSLHLEALYGVRKEVHPLTCNGRKGVIPQVLESRQPSVIHHLSQEPLYQEVNDRMKGIEKIRPPLLCIPLITGNEPLGVININPLYGLRNEFKEDFQFLSLLSNLLSPAIKKYQTKMEEPFQRPVKPKENFHLLDELLEEKLTEVINKIDPYVESKTKLSIFDDIISLVEKALIRSALKRVGNVQTTAAQLLGINRNTLRKKIKELKIKAR